jgi:hypothetical protein
MDLQPPAQLEMFPAGENFIKISRISVPAMMKWPNDN